MTINSPKKLQLKMTENNNLVVICWGGDGMRKRGRKKRRRWRTKGGRIRGKNQHGKGEEGCKGEVPLVCLVS